MQQREFLAECDVFLKYLNSLGERTIANRDQLNQLIESNQIKSSLSSILSHMKKRKHIKQFGGPMAQLIQDGREFARQTTYVEEYDKLYREGEIKDLETEDTPNKILREKRTYFIALITLIAGVAGWIIGRLTCN